MGYTASTATRLAVDSRLMRKLLILLACSGLALTMFAGCSVMVLFAGSNSTPHSLPCGGGASGSGQLGSSQIADAEQKIGVELPFSREYFHWGQRIRTISNHTPIASVNGNGMAWATIASGSQDNTIRQQAADVRAISGTVYLALDHEPEHDTRGTPVQYIAAWRHYESVYATVGVTNVQWTFIGTAAGYPSKADSYYPGDDLIAVVAADGYNWPGQNRSFAEVFANLHSFAVAHSKPAMVAEFATMPGPTEGSWINAAQATATSWNLLAASWYNNAEWTLSGDAIPALKVWVGGAPSARTIAITTSALSGQQVAETAIAGGFPQDQLVTAVAVAKAESDWQPTIRNSIGASGLWQILESAHPDLFAKYNWQAPVDNARMAFSIYTSAGSSWRPWVTYTTGAYTRYLDEAQAAVNAAGGGILPVSDTTCGQPTIPSSGNSGIVQWAEGHLGISYLWGGCLAGVPSCSAPTDPNMDCSGFSSAAYWFGANRAIPRTAAAQWAAATIIPPGQEQPGDLIFTEMGNNGPGHVMIVVSPGNPGIAVESPHTGDVTKNISFSEAGGVFGRPS